MRPLQTVQIDEHFTSWSLENQTLASIVWMKTLILYRHQMLLRLELPEKWPENLRVAVTHFP